MNIGLPGTGLGGLFYLVAALLMPLVALYRAARGGPPRWGLALRQAAYAIIILLVFSLEYRGLTWITDQLGARFPAVATHTATVAQTLGASPVIFAAFTILLLVLMVLVVEGLSLYLRLRHHPG